jgi:hypothetical protein
VDIGDAGAGLIGAQDDGADGKSAVRRIAGCCSGGRGQALKFRHAEKARRIEAPSGEHAHERNDHTVETS